MDGIEGFPGIKVENTMKTVVTTFFNGITCAVCKCLELLPEITSWLRIQWIRCLYHQRWNAQWQAPVRRPRPLGLNNHQILEATRMVFTVKPVRFCVNIQSTGGGIPPMIGLLASGNEAIMTCIIVLLKGMQWLSRNRSPRLGFRHLP